MSTTAAVDFDGQRLASGHFGRLWKVHDCQGLTFVDELDFRVEVDRFDGGDLRYFGNDQVVVIADEDRFAFSVSSAETGATLTDGAASSAGTSSTNPTLIGA